MTDSGKLPKDWQKKFAIILLCWTTIALLAAAFFFPLPRLIAVAAGVLCLAAGLKITELLISIFTGLRKANATALVLLVFLKLAWWAALFWGARHVSQETASALGIGFGAFLLSVLTLGLRVFGMPKIFPEAGSGDS